MFLKYLKKAFDSGRLHFFGSLEQLRDAHEFRSYIAPLKETEWVVYAKPPFAGPQHVLDYVGRYTHRVAISNNRLLHMEQDRITFLWKDYRHNHRQKSMTLPAEEFIRRFLIHVLPDAFQRIRYYGFLSNRHREEKLALCRQLLGMPAVDLETAPGDQPTDCDYEALYEKLTDSSLRQCPICRQGRMVVVEILTQLLRCSSIHHDDFCGLWTATTRKPQSELCSTCARIARHSPDPTLRADYFHPLFQRTAFRTASYTANPIAPPASFTEIHRFRSVRPPFNTRLQFNNQDCNIFHAV